MPLPKPRKKEKQNHFIDRCMKDDIMIKEFPNNKQRVAVCYSQWREWEKKKKIQGKIGLIDVR